MSVSVQETQNSLHNITTAKRNKMSLQVILRQFNVGSSIANGLSNNPFFLFIEVTNGGASVMTTMAHEDKHFIQIVIRVIQFYLVTVNQHKALGASEICHVVMITRRR
jgi:hypothetical protein